MDETAQLMSLLEAQAKSLRDGRGGEDRDRTCASRRTRRLSKALPYRSATSPESGIWLAFATSAIGLPYGRTEEVH